MFRKVAFVTALAAAVCAVAPFAAFAVDVDLSTPKAAAKTFGQGMSEGDATAVKAAAIADGEQQQALDALVKVVTNFKQVEEAGVAKFGEAGKTIANQQQMSIGEELAKIDTAEEIIEGDTATLKSADSPEPLHLRKVEGQWKVDFAAMPGSDQVGQALPMINAMADAAGELATEISADKYKTADEAKTALGQKMMAAMMALQGAPGMDDPSATEPAMEDPATDDMDATDAPPTDDAAVDEVPADAAPMEDAPADDAGDAGADEAQEPVTAEPAQP